MKLRGPKGNKTQKLWGEKEKQKEEYSGLHRPLQKHVIFIYLKWNRKEFEKIHKDKND